MQRIPAVCTLLLGFWAAALAAEGSQGARNRVPVLVELFTSEGCSSCPPADALLQQLDQAQPVAGVEAIVLSEHVDYWNHIGWKDPFSSSLFSDRQNRYGSRFGLSSVYTPQMIVDGAAEFTGSDSERAQAAIVKAATESKLTVSLLSVSVDATNLLRATVEVDNGQSPGKPRNADVYVALALDHAESQVVRGENAGRNLSHTGVVKKLEKIGRFRPGEKFTRNLELKIDPALVSSRLRVVAFVQEDGMGKVLGATVRGIDRAEINGISTGHPDQSARR